MRLRAPIYLAVSLFLFAQHAFAESSHTRKKFFSHTKALLNETVSQRSLTKQEPLYGSNYIIPKTRIKIRLPGVGRTSIEIDRRRLTPQEKKQIRKGAKTKQDSSIILLKGTAMVRGTHYPLAANITQKKKQILQASVSIPHRKTGKAIHFELFVPYTDTTKKVRVRRSRINHAHDHDFLPVPEKERAKLDHVHTDGAILPHTRNNSNFLVTEIGLYADKQFHNGNTASAENRILSLVNYAEAIFEPNLGITFDVVNITLWQENPPGYEDTPSIYTRHSAFIKELNREGDLWRADVFHLFTGTFSSGEPILGIAYQGTVCSNSSIKSGVTKWLNSTASGLTFAHELAHSFGAGHVTNPVTNLMFTGINGSSHIAQQTKDQVARFVERRSCLSSPAAPPDADGDGVEDEDDNCPDVSNESQTDTDNDGKGNACDTDDDNDGHLDTNDCAPTVGSQWRNRAYNDSDRDGIRNSSTLSQTSCFGSNAPAGFTLSTGNVDNCPTVKNANQLNTDGDSQGNACDANDDNDARNDSSDCAPLDRTKWQNRVYVDSDRDGIRDTTTATTIACFGSTPPSGYTLQTNGPDNCPNVANSSQTDQDKDGIGDSCDASPTPTPTPAPTPTPTPEPAPSPTPTPTPGSGSLPTPSPLPGEDPELPLPPPVPVQVVNDLTGDGRTNISLYQPSTRTILLLSTNGTEVGTYTLSEIPSIREIITGHYSDTSTADIITVSETSKGLQWRIVSPTTGDTQIIELGKRRHQPLFGCDLDGDRIDDIAYITKRGKVSYIASSTGQKEKLRLKVRGAPQTATPLCEDLNGDGRDEIALLSKIEKGERTITLLQILQIEGKTTLFFKKRMPKSAQALLIGDINDNGTNSILTYKTGKKKSSSLDGFILTDEKKLDQKISVLLPDRKFSMGYTLKIHGRMSIILEDTGGVIHSLSSSNDTGKILYEKKNDELLIPSR